MTVRKRRWFKLLHSSAGRSRQREDEVCILVEEASEEEDELEAEPEAMGHSARPPRLSTLLVQAPRLRPEVAIVRMNASSVVVPYVTPTPVTTAQSSVVARAEPALANSQREPAALNFHRPTSSFPHLRALLRRRSSKAQAPTTAPTSRAVPAAPGDRLLRKEEDLDRLLSETWTALLEAPSRRHSRKAAKLRDEYERRLAEIVQREATFASRLLWCDDATPLLSASEAERMVLDAGRELADALVEARRRFDKLRYDLKSEVARKAVSLRGRADGVNGVSGSIASCVLSSAVVEDR